MTKTTLRHLQHIKWSRGGLRTALYPRKTPNKKLFGKGRSEGKKGGGMVVVFLAFLWCCANGGTISPAPTTTRTTTSTTTAPSPLSFCGQFNKSTTLLSGVVSLCWTVNPAPASSISFGLEVQGNGWIAFGITNQNGGGMTNADIVFCSVTAGCSDRWSTQRSTPSLDAVQNINSASVSHPASGFTRAAWTRPLVSGDIVHDRDIILTTQMEVMVAYQANSDSDAIKHTDKTMTYVNFGTGSVPSTGGNTASTVQIDPTNYDHVITVLLGQCGIYWRIIQATATINIGVEVFAPFAQVSLTLANSVSTPDTSALVSAINLAMG